MTEIDFTILNWIQEHIRSQFMDILMPEITFLGEYGWLWIFLAFLFLIKKETRKLGISILIGLIGGVLIGNVILKPLIGRPRPCWINTSTDMLIAIPRDYSFPSGHTLSCSIASTVIQKHNKRLSIIAWLITLAVGFSRLYLYVHYPSDVVVGLILGIIIGLYTVRINKKDVEDR